MQQTYNIWRNSKWIRQQLAPLLMVIIGAILIGIVMLIFANRITVENPFLLIVKYSDASKNDNRLTKN
ncbi:hypothetical protein ACIQYG_03660 [Peribacillus sp. NPDC096622]|uniref:hypothetical protein n=1 Tax=Peribacillus sp. NPDC096622 TaxID=3364396 RepID=UPI0037F563AB